MRQLTVKLAAISFRCLVPSFIIGLLFLITIWHSNGHAADSSMQSYSDAEQWILEHVASENITDLLDIFPNESDRVLSARFLEELLANSAEEKVHRSGVRIANAIITEPINLKLAEIPYETRLIAFRFEEDVDFSQSNFLKGLSLIGANFTEAAFFNDMKVGRDADFSNADFTEQVDFTGIEVGGDALFWKTVFRSKAIFAEADIRGDFDLEGANFTDEVDFNSIKVGGSAYFRNTDFTGPVDFANIEVGGDALFWKTVFRSEAIFTAADIHKDFDLKEAQFFGTASFYEMRVAGSAYFYNAAFWREAIFAEADIHKDFKIVGETSSTYIYDASFRGMKVGRNVYFREAVFYTPVDFTCIEVGRDAEFWKIVFWGEAKFTEADIHGNLKIVEDIHFIDVASFRSMKVGQAAHFRDIVFAGRVYMTHSKFTRVYFTDVIWPNAPQSIWLEGMTYGYIEAGDKEESFKNLLDIVGIAEYRTSVYTNLESFFRNNGEIAKADEIFVAQKRRERSEILGGWQRLLSVFLDWSVGYGLHPWRVIIPIVPPLLTGLLIFKERHMTLNEPMAPQPRYNVFWYTFDLFIPFVDLKVASAWTPREGYGILTWFRRHYVRVHIFLGWILIPIGLLALIGIIK